MSRRSRFIPGHPGPLENRVVLSHLSPALVSRPGRDRVVAGQSRQSQADQVSQAFDLFQTDYTQSRATYLTSIQNVPNPSPATMAAFTLYTTERVNLLAEQLLDASVPKRLVGKKIIGDRQQMPMGSLARTLNQTIPQPGVTAPSISLYTLSQDNAIEAARLAILHGLKQGK
ncbi:MAG: hypothetical protein ACYC61_16005 [Isosphaeraceae bacterium]